MYPPQVLLPIFVERYAITEAQAALLTATIMIPLSIAPLSYGYILETVSSAKLVRWSILGLALTQLAFVLAEMVSDSFALLIGIRFIQGLLLPAAMTALMTYLSRFSQSNQVQRNMSIYIAATIIGAYLGRLLAGAAAEYSDWRFFFFALAAALLVCFFLLKKRLKQPAEIKAGRPSPRIILETVRTGDYAKLYAIIFCTFFVFAALLNFLPFRLAELWQEPSQFATGMMYSGYLPGVFVSLGSDRIIRFLGNSNKAMMLGLIGYVIALFTMTTQSTAVLFGALVIFCCSMFLIHSVAAGLANRLASQNKGVVNGLYVAFYYSGGVLGSYLPGLVYQEYGWSSFLATLIIVAGLGLGVSLIYKVRPGQLTSEYRM